jgi:hypothetical protein
LTPPASRGPQFYIDIVFHDSRELEWLPTVETFQDQLISLLQQMETTVGQLPVMAPDEIPMDISRVSFEDCLQLIRDQREVCDQVLTQLFQQLHEFMDQNKYIEEILHLNADGFALSFDPDGTRPLEDYRIKLSSLQETFARVRDEVKSYYYLGLFRVSCKSFKDTAIGHIRELMVNLLTRIKSLLMATVADLKGDFDGIPSSSMNTPTTPEELTEMKVYLEGVIASKHDRELKMQAVQDRFAFLEDFGYSLEDEEFNARFQTLTMPAKITALIEETDRSVGQIRLKLIRDLRANQRRLENDTLAMSSVLTGFISKFTDLDLTYDACEQVNKIGEQLQALKQDQDLYNSHEKLFDFEVANSRILAKLFDEFTPLHMLWNLAHEWNSVSNTWLQRNFLQIKAETLDQFLQSAARKVQKVKQDLQSQRVLLEKVVNPLSAQLDAFRRHMPLISKLRHPSIKAQHWDQISEVVGFRVCPTVETTLQEFLALDLRRWFQKISDIAGIAAQEFAIESSLDKMDLELQNLHLTTVEHQAMSQFVLQKVSELVAVIDDQVIATQTLLTSPFIAPVKDRAVERLEFLKTTRLILS